MEPIEARLVDDLFVDDESQRKPGEYKPWSRYADPTNAIAGLNFRCPGCNNIIGVEFASNKWQWNNNLNCPTVTPSIVHIKTEPDNCGWHGFLTNGKFITV